MDAALESALIRYVEESELNQALLDKVAGYLEVLADETDIEKEIWSKTETALENYRQTLEDADKKDQEASDQLLKEFVAKSEALVNSIQSAGVSAVQPSPQPPQPESPPQEVSVPAPTPSPVPISAPAPILTPNPSPVV